MKLAVFASGSGTNFENLVKQGIPITFLFTDKRDAKALARAEKLGIQSHTFALKEFEDKAAYETELLNLLAQYDIDLIVLAGYMKIVSPTLLQAYEGRIINIHPAYLPEFPGA
ncbi:MAG: phosphoribosylglycinamide formyltransferase, partial [Lactococcus raffinolactis]|nr:phosphoribosylglycinamide formyltransferase [Lactococcus raffinolactis]